MTNKRYCEEAISIDNQIKEQIKERKKRTKYEDQDPETDPKSKGVPLSDISNNTTVDGDCDEDEYGYCTEELNNHIQQEISNQQDDEDNEHRQQEQVEEESEINSEYEEIEYNSDDDTSSGSSSDDSPDEEEIEERNRIISSKLESDPTLDIETFAKNLIREHIQTKKNEGVDPISFTRDLGFKLELDEEDDEDNPWELIESFLTRKKIALHLFFNYMKYQSFSRPYRRKLDSVNSMDDVVQLFKTCKNIVIVTGAGISVSVGIPDFRSKGGVYETIERKYNLPEPESLFDIHYLRDNPLPFFEFAKEIYPGRHKPSPTHYFIRELDRRGILLRNYTQNIDTLEHVAGITPEKLVNCHGSFSTASCISCKHTVDCDDLRETIMLQQVPLCPLCKDSESFMKPNIVFFGENLPDRFDQCVREDRPKIDLFIVMGSSLKVQPVSLLPEVLDPSIPQILINREIVGQPHQFDYVYLGDCDSFVQEIQSKLEWIKE